MAEDDAPGVEIRFGTEPIARLLWAEIEPEMRRGTLTFEILAANLDKAMLAHIGKAALATKRAEPRGKPN